MGVHGILDYFYLFFAFVRVDIPPEFYTAGVLFLFILIDSNAIYCRRSLWLHACTPRHSGIGCSQ